MKLSEKIQEALRQQQEINLSDPAVQKRLAAQWGYVPADAQPAPSFADAYQGAMEEVAIWKRRALKAEDLNRKFVAEINGPMHMGEPAQPAPSLASNDVSLISEGKTQPAPSIPDGWLRAIDEALIVAHIGVANPSDTYEQAKAKLDNLIGFHVDAATDPAVNGGWKLVPRPPTPTMVKAGLGSSHVLNVHRVLACYDAMIDAAPEAKP